MARKMKKFADGGSDKYKARYDRKVADIESDYEKAKARKTGRAAEVAKAKYEQRMADAKDDLAKWTKGDRTQTRAAEKAAERNLTLTRRYGSAEPKFDDKPLVSGRPSDAELTKLTAGVGQKLSDAGNFGSAFRAARKAGDKTFTWKGKSYTTQLASEKKVAPAPVRRTAPAASSRASAPASAPRKETKAAAPAVSATKANAPVTRETAFAALQSKPKGTPAPAAKAKETPKSGAQQRGDYAARLTQSAAEKRKLESAPTGTPGAALARLKNLVGFGSSADERLAATMRRSAATEAQNEVRKRNAAAAEAAARAKRIEEGKAKARAGNPFYQSYLDKAKGGSVKGYAKGGKIDGCAVRGKTKAMRKK